MDKLAAINFLESSISSGFQITIPLLLLERGLDLVTIGIIFSIMPLVFFSARLLFASLADQMGVKKFFISSGACAAIASAFYLSAASPLVFSLGKTFEGLKSSSFWAVNRTAVVQLSKDKAEKQAALLSGIRSFALSMGMLIPGIIISFYSFEASLLAMLAASTAIIFFSLALPKKFENEQGPTLSSTLKQLDPRKKPARFWLVSLTIPFIDVPTYTVLPFILAVFMRAQLGFDYATIGFSLAAYYAIQSLGTFFSVKTKMTSKHVAVLATLLFTPSAAAIAFTNGYAFIALSLAMSFACGLCLKSFESLLIKTAEKSKTISVDIGLLHIPIRAGEFVFYLLVGLLVKWFSYASIFWLCAAAIAIFSLSSKQLLENRKIEQTAKVLRFATSKPDVVK